MSEPSPSAPLEFSQDEMREFGYQVIDTLVDYYASRADRTGGGKAGL